MLERTQNAVATQVERKAPDRRRRIQNIIDEKKHTAHLTQILVQIKAWPHTGRIHTIRHSFIHTIQLAQRPIHTGYAWFSSTQQ